MKPNNKVTLERAPEPPRQSEWGMFCEIIPFMYAAWIAAKSVGLDRDRYA